MFVERNINAQLGHGVFSMYCAQKVLGHHAIRPFQRRFVIPLVEEAESASPVKTKNCRKLDELSRSSILCDTYRNALPALIRLAMVLALQISVPYK